MNKEQFKSFVNPLFYKGVCHRGVHDKEATENGLKAFKRAIDRGMAFEFDIHLTKDKKLVVFHDSNLLRCTGKDGIIEEKTLEELKRDYKLLDGEEIPSLEEVLSLNNEKVPMVIELKVYNKNFKELAKYTNQALKQIKDKKNVIVISFDFFALRRIKGFMRQLLICEKYEWVFKFRRFFEGLDIEYTLTRKEKFQKYFKHHCVNAWTIQSTEQYRFAKDFIDMCTFDTVTPEEIQKEFI